MSVYPHSNLKKLEIKPASIFHQNIELENIKKLFKY